MIFALALLLTLVFSNVTAPATPAVPSSDRAQVATRLAASYEQSRPGPARTVLALQVEQAVARFPGRLSPVFIWPDPAILKSVVDGRGNVDDALREAAAVTQRAERFERALSPEQVRTLTASLSYGLNHRVGRLLLAARSRGCGDTEYKLLKNKYPLPELIQNASTVMGLASFYESLDQPEINRLVASFLKKNPDYETKFPGVTAFYDFFGSRHIDFEAAQNIKFQIRTLEAKVDRGWVGKIQVYEYVSKMVLTSPDCLMMPSRDLEERLHRDGIKGH